MPGWLRKALAAAGVLAVAYAVVVALCVYRMAKGGEFLEDFGGED